MLDIACMETDGRSRSDDRFVHATTSFVGTTERKVQRVSRMSGPIGRRAAQRPVWRQRPIGRSVPHADLQSAFDHGERRAIEAPFAHADLDRAQQRNHLTATLAGEVARKAEVSRCLFFHFSPRYHEADTNLQDEAERAFRGLL